MLFILMETSIMETMSMDRGLVKENISMPVEIDMTVHLLTIKSMELVDLLPKIKDNTMVLF